MFEERNKLCLGLSVVSDRFGVGMHSRTNPSLSS